MPLMVLKIKESVTGAWRERACSSLSIAQLTEDKSIGGFTMSTKKRFKTRNGHLSIVHLTTHYSALQIFKRQNFVVIPVDMALLVEK